MYAHVAYVDSENKQSVLVERSYKNPQKDLENTTNIFPKSFQISSKMKEIGARGYPKEATRSEDETSSGGA